MKKIIAHIVLWTILVALAVLLGYKIIIDPCIQLYKSCGFYGIIAWIIVLTIIVILFWAFFKLIDWAIDNL